MKLKPEQVIYHKTLITIEILSEGKYTPSSLKDIDYDITEGQCSGVWHITHAAILTRDAMANALKVQGSDPDFLLEPGGLNYD